MLNYVIVFQDGMYESDVDNKKMSCIDVIFIQNMDNVQMF